MKIEILLILAFALVAYLGAATPSGISSQLLASSISSSLGLTSATLPIALATFSTLIWAVCISVHRRNINVARALGIVAALIAGHAARFAWQLNSGAHIVTLWGIALAIAVTSSIATRNKNSNPFGDGATLSPGSSPTNYSMTRLEWIVFLAIATCSAALLSFRLLDVPGELNGFGTQAISSANRLLRGEVSVRDLVLYREMTQEECGNSLPFVLLHAFLQVLFGGPSLTAARIVCAGASWLSVLMMFRVGRHVGGVALGLIAMATYAAIPVTLYNARTEGIFGFSALLILVICDVFFVFLRKPSIKHAGLAGIVAPLVGYGIANIKFYFLALICTLIFIVIRGKHFGRYLGYGVITATVGFITLIPQVLNLAEVERRMKGRGEHVFGGVLSHLAIIDPAKPTPFEKALEILQENSQYLLQETFGPWRENMTSLSATLCIPMVIGLCLIVSAPFVPSRLFAGLMWLGAYTAPLISIPIGWTRILMLNIAQTLVISIVWLELLYVIKSTRLRRVGLPIWCLSVALSLSSAFGPARSFFSRPYGLSHARRVILQQPPGTVVFFTDKHESSANFLRWNPPYIGRDSRAERQLIGIREEGVPAMVSLVERLGISAMIVSNEAPPSQIASVSTWRHERITESLWSMTFVPPTGPARPVVHVLEATKLGPTSPVIPENLAYGSPRLFLTRVTPESPLNLELQNDSDLERVAILARGRNSYAALTTVVVDSGAVPVETVQQVSTKASSTWFYLPQLSSGTHTVTVQAKPDESASTVLVDDIVVIGLPRTK